MAKLFFMLGPLVDFVYIVSIYSIYAARLAIKIKGNFHVMEVVVLILKAYLLFQQSR